MSQYHVVEPSALRTDAEFTWHTQQGKLNAELIGLLADMNVTWRDGEPKRMNGGKDFHSAGGTMLVKGEGQVVDQMFQITLTSIPINKKKADAHAKNAPKSGNNDIAPNPDDDYA